MDYLVSMVQPPPEKEIVKIYPHCVVCGRKADDFVSKFVFLCKDHNNKWSKSFKSESHRQWKREWESQFLQFLKKYTQK